MRNKYDKKTLLWIGNQHKEHFTTMTHWNEYAKENKLPSSQAYISRFGSWDKTKKELNLKPSNIGYTKEEIVDVIKEHRTKFTSAFKWNQYAKENKLPYYHTITEYFDWRTVKKMAKVKTHNYTKDELLEIAMKHREYFTSMTTWNNYAREANLPSAMGYVRAFGSWKRSKHEIEIRK